MKLQRSMARRLHRLCCVVLPKSNHKERIVSNFEVFDFSLTEDEMAEIDELNRDLRTGGNPDHFDF